MFGISIGEIFLILIISLVVFGPKQLAEIAKTILLLIHTFKTYMENLKQQIYHETGAHELIQTKDQVINSCLTIKNDLTDTLVKPNKPKTKKAHNDDNQPNLFANSLDNNN